VLEIDELQVQRKGFRVQVANLKVEAAQRLTIIGPSGGGKSTLLRAMVGLEPLARVRGLRWQGADITLARPHQRPFGWLPQELGLWPSLRSGEHVAFARTRGRSTKPDPADLQVLDMVALSHRVDAYPATLSGGERQRLAFARVIACRAPWAVLDEPFSNLDPVIANDLAQAFGALAKREGMGLIQVSHQVRRPQGDEVFWVIEDGNLTQAGPWQDMQRMPATPWIERFVGLQ